MFTIAVAFLLIIFFFVIEGRLRQGERAKSFDAGEADQGSTRRVGQAFGISVIVMLLALALDFFKVAELPDGSPVGWIGLGLMLAGIGMRVWATRVLGRFYTRTLVTDGGQRIVRDGPYRLIRHPGYLGTLLLWVGAALAAVNWAAIIVIPLVTLPAYVFRIRSEEAMLSRTFGAQYQDYQRHSWRLLPPLY
jgi:protein-S-isoprenylcysteine O-methyltransferase Ste14